VGKQKMPDFQSKNTEIRKAVAYFAMIYLGIRTKLKLLAGLALKAAQRVF